MGKTFKTNASIVGSVTWGFRGRRIILPLHVCRMAQSGYIENAILEIFCACRQINGSASVRSSALPLPIILCHCDSCRHSSGLLCVSTVSLPKDSSSFQVHGKLKGYKISTNRTIFFCEHCGASIYDMNTDLDVASICTGVLGRSDGIVESKQLNYVADSKDDGLSVWLRDKVAGEDQAHKTGRSQYTSKALPVGPGNDSTESSPKLPGYCHCGGVQFQITRPNKHSTELFSPWPDLLVPYHSGSSANIDVKWWLREGFTKYLAGTCACNSCRLASGYDIQVWAFVPKTNILQSNGQPLHFSMGTLRQFQSSEGIYREFCSSCGATVFWHCDERPDLIDVSVGLLHAESGARAESWLEWWTERVSFEENAQNKALISRLGMGLKNWAVVKAGTPDTAPS